MTCVGCAPFSFHPLARLRRLQLFRMGTDRAPRGVRPGPRAVQVRRGGLACHILSWEGEGAMGPHLGPRLLHFNTALWHSHPGWAWCVGNWSPGAQGNLAGLGGQIAGAWGSSSLTVLSSLVLCVYMLRV